MSGRRLGRFWEARSHLAASERMLDTAASAAAAAAADNDDDIVAVVGCAGWWVRRVSGGSSSSGSSSRPHLDPAVALGQDGGGYQIR